MTNSSPTNTKSTPKNKKTLVPQRPRKEKGETAIQSLRKLKAFAQDAWNIEKILDHMENEVLNRIDEHAIPSVHLLHDENDNETLIQVDHWHRLLSEIEAARAELGKGDPSRIALTFLELGRRSHYQEVDHIIAAARERADPLDRINQRKADAKQEAQRLADTRWKNDTTQSIRIGDMAGLVWNDLVDMGYTDALPDKPAGLRSWIKEIAPPHASKRGRSKKIK